MLRKIFLFFLLSSLFGCSDKDEKGQIIDYFLSKNPEMVFQINDKNQFISSVINNDFWNEYFKYYPNANVKNLLNSLPVNNKIWLAYTNDAVFCGLPVSNEDSLSIWHNASLNKLDSMLIQQKKWFYIKDDNELIISSLKEIEIPKKEEENNEKFHQLAKITNKELPANLFLTEEKSKIIFSEFFTENINNFFKDWSVWDIFLEKNTIRLSGSALKSKENSQKISLTSPKNQNFENINHISPKFSQLRSYVFNEDMLDNNFFFNFQRDISEVNIFNIDKNEIGVLVSENTEEMLRYFTILKTQEYLGKTIYQIEENPDFTSFFELFGAKIQPKYLFQHNNSFFLTEKAEILQEIIYPIQYSGSLGSEITFFEFTKKTASQSSFIAINNLLNNRDFHAKYPKISKKYNFVSLQVSEQNEYYIFTFTGNNFVPIYNEGNLTGKFEITLDQDAQTEPFFVTNHRTNRREIVIQDIDNQLYLIGNDGKILWKKRLDGAIQGEIFQVDLFQNGFLQLAFTTEHSLWVIDRNGNNVSPFPTSYKETLLPLQVFDYERNKDYRFVVSSPNQMRILDKKGVQIKGFEKSSIPNGMWQTPKHFRLNGKDFIVIPERNGTLNVLHRNGKTRVPISRKFDFSNNPIVLENDFITFTTKSGEQFYMDSNGGMRSVHRNLSKQHFFDNKKGVEVFLSDNILTINKKKIELPYSIYSAPKIESAGKETFISVTDTQNNDIFVFNSRGELLPSFPIFGVSRADITQDNGKNILVFLKEKNILFVYEF
ncbi:MAG: hypothetical protein Q3983_02075 [Capnocytophaga sp.]|nr:hypothetical protein [Capnocytophaga sp.]